MLSTDKNMTEILTFLKELISAPGISGYESAVRPLIEKSWEGVTDALSVSRLGSLHGLQRGTGAKPRPSILVAAHMDAIGLMVNVGLLPEEVTNLVRVGDTISFAQPPIETAGKTLVGHTLDNRASVAALTHCLELLRLRPHVWDVWAVATVQEETTLGGALTSALP